MTSVARVAIIFLVVFVAMQFMTLNLQTPYNSKVEKKFQAMSINEREKK
jgi:hypothetical protein